MSTLELTLAGPLAAWADSPGYTIRSTGDKPDRRQLLGLIGCVMGLERGKPNPMSHLRFQVETIHAPRFGEDYHTVDRGTGTIIIRDKVCMDGAWKVTLHGERDLLEQVKHAFLHPVWAPYLGRRSYIPSEPILTQFTEIHDDGTTDPFDLAKEA
ncbi:type I-E CRISPR-associated protein Cas5/CasD [Bifidobacterium sp. SO1]|uniref:type I-E CRISPR-associated protein Cas5/CasD n=1 Tax=Bifidobacterium sp. SO1 TaxID=2809029 RepID=UPI001BDD9796|nr:type I-E CRISPR-associated protein Cas5/CasD [Bifidobacterium sp. SO1]MBT1161719.1 hypothetical protein [Bifidobacterium sp. SO1]